MVAPYAGSVFYGAQLLVLGIRTQCRAAIDPVPPASDDLLVTVMDEREYLVKAQEAEAVANAAENPREQRRWETMAIEYRRLSKIVATMRRSKVSNDR